MKRFSLYYYTHDSLVLRRLPWGRSRFVALGLVGGVCLLYGVMEVNQRYGDVLGLGMIRTDLVQNENRILKEQLQLANIHVSGLEKKLAALNEDANGVRLMVDLPKIDEDVRRAGIGGTDTRIDFSSSTDVNDLLNGLRSNITRTEKELELQAASYREVAMTFEKNKDRYRHLPAIKPMEGYYSRNGFGLRLHPILHIYMPHEGIDIANDVGTPVYATADGVVRFSGRDAGYGISVLLDHGYSYKTRYAHLSKSLVREGQTVHRGDMIARSGNTGLSTGPHLHYEVRLNGIPQEPLNYFFDDINYQKYKAQDQPAD